MEGSILNESEISFSGGLSCDELVMDLTLYIGKKIKITLLVPTNYYYVGKVIGADENSIDLIDIKGKNISLRKESIEKIQEVGF